MRPPIATVEKNNKQKNGDKETSKIGGKNLGKIHEANIQLIHLICPRNFKKKLSGFFDPKEFQYNEISKAVFF